MSQEFRRVTIEDVNEQLRIVVEERLREIIGGRHPGHCMRVGDLDTALMLEIAQNLRSVIGFRDCRTQDARSDPGCALAGASGRIPREVAASGSPQPLDPHHILCDSAEPRSFFVSISEWRR